VIDDVHRACHTLSLETQKIGTSDDQKQLLNKKIKEGTSIIEMISKLKYGMARNYVLECELSPTLPSSEAV
jgi:damage-control phosphatase, subfamily III